MSFRNSTLALTLAVAGACFAGSVAYASVFEGEQCSAHIMTGHPGINVTVPDGAVFRSHGVFPSIAKKLLVRWTHRSGKVVSEKMVRFWVSF
jgi:hypothetical protein